MTKLITFGQLLQIKREVMGLNLKEVTERIGLAQGSLSSYETDKSKPRPEARAKIIEFYKITKEELRDLKVNEASKHSNKNKTGLKDALNILLDTMKKVDDFKGVGGLASKIKEDTLINLEEAKRLIEDVLIIDEII